MSNRDERLSFFNPYAVDLPDEISRMESLEFNESERKLSYMRDGVLHEKVFPYASKDDLTDVQYDLDDLVLHTESSTIIVPDATVTFDHVLSATGSSGTLQNGSFVPLNSSGGIYIAEESERFLVTQDEPDVSNSESAVGIVGDYTSINDSTPEGMVLITSGNIETWIPIAVNGKEDPYEFITVTQDGGFQLPEGIYWLDFFLSAFRCDRVRIAVFDQDNNRVLDFIQAFSNASGHDGSVSGSGYIKSNGTDVFRFAVICSGFSNTGYINHSNSSIHSTSGGTYTSSFRVMVSKESVPSSMEVPTLPLMEPVIEPMSSAETTTQKLTVSSQHSNDVASWRATVDDDSPWFSAQNDPSPFYMIEFKDGPRDIDWIMLCDINHVRRNPEPHSLMDFVFEYRETEQSSWITAGSFTDVLHNVSGSAFVHRFPATITAQAVRLTEMVSSSPDGWTTFGFIQLFKEVPNPTVLE